MGEYVSGDWLGALTAIPFNVVASQQRQREIENAEAFQREQIDLQKQFAQNSIQWKVADAQKAGINPYYALGSPAMSYTPLVDTTPSMSDFTQSMGQSVANLGQSISGAMAQARALKVQERLADSQVKSSELDNKLKELEILSRARELEQPSFDYSVANVADARGRRDFGFKNQALEELYSEAEGYYGMLRQLMLSADMYHYAGAYQKKYAPDWKLGYNEAIGKPYLTQNDKDLGTQPILSQRFIRQVNYLLREGAKLGLDKTTTLLEVYNESKKFGYGKGFDIFVDSILKDDSPFKSR